MKKKIFSALALVLAFALVFTGMGKTTKASASTYGRNNYYNNNWWFWGWYDYDWDSSNYNKTTFTVKYYTAAPERDFIEAKTYEGTWNKDYKWDTSKKGAFVAEIDLPKSYDSLAKGYEVAGWNFGDTWKGDGKFPTVDQDAQTNIIHGYANYEKPVFECYAVIAEVGGQPIPDVLYTVKFEGNDNAVQVDKKIGDVIDLPENYYGKCPEGEHFSGWDKGENGVYTVAAIDANKDNVIIITPVFEGDVVEGDEHDDPEGETVTPGEPAENEPTGEPEVPVEPVVEPVVPAEPVSQPENDYIPVVLPQSVVEEKEEVVEVPEVVETPEAPVEEEVEEEIEVVEEVEETIDTTVPETPEADASLPQTGVAPASLFYGMGAAIIALGGAMIIFGRRKQF